MNKMIKGSIAGATGVALLMGGYGTYALWSDSATTDVSNVASGTMTVVANNDAVYDDAAAGAWNSASDKIVPGDVITRAQSFTLNGTGKNLKGYIQFTPGATTIPAAWTSYLTIGVAATGDAPFTTLNNPGQLCVAFTAPFTTANVDTVVTFTFDPSTPNEVAQGLSASIAGSTLEIHQNATGTCPA